MGLNRSHFAALVGFGDGRPPLLEVADKVAKIFLGGDDVELHDRL